MLVVMMYDLTVQTIVEYVLQMRYEWRAYTYFP